MNIYLKNNSSVIYVLVLFQHLLFEHTIYFVISTVILWFKFDNVYLIHEGIHIHIACVWVIHATIRVYGVSVIRVLKLITIVKSKK